MTDDRVKAIAQIARAEAKEAPQECYAAIFSVVFQALIYDEQLREERPSSAATAAE